MEIRAMRHFESPWAPGHRWVCRGDPAPDVPAAGHRSTAGRDESTRANIQPDIFYPAASTPDRQKRFRKDGTDVGESRQRCWDDMSQSSEKQRYRSGRPSERSMGVVNVIQAWDPGCVDDVLAERREAIYESAKREPLGQAYRRGHEAPALLSEQGFQFGQATGSAKHSWCQSGKDVITPSCGRRDLQTHEQYVRSHQSFAPGEQVNRRYEWPLHVSPDHAFGFSDHVAAQDGSGVRDALAGYDSGADQRTRLVCLKGEDCRKTVSYPLGGRPVPRWSPPVPDGSAFGTPTKVASSAGELIHGLYSPEEQRPDRDLGCCLRVGRRNYANERSFGKPSRCLGEAAAAEVMYPKRFADRGITGDFSEPRDMSEVRSLFEDSGCLQQPDDFDVAWEAAATKAGVFKLGTGAVKVPLEAMAKAFAERRAQRSASTPELRSIRRE